MRHRRLATLTLLAASLAAPPAALAAPPVAGNDQVATNEDTAITIDVLANDSDPDGDQLRIESFDQPASGNVDVTPVAGLLRYVPDQDFNGQDRFAYTVSDGVGGTATAFVAVFVIAVNDPPTAWDRVVSVEEDGSVEILFGGTDADKERCDLVFVAERQTPFGRLGPFVDAGCNPNGDMATAVYTPLPGYNGPDTISYLVSDGTVQSDFATVHITVTPVDDPPVALPGSAATTSGAPISIRLDGYDWETCELGFAVSTGPSHGSLSGIGAVPCGPGGPVDQHVDAATIAYTPAAGFVGTDSFTFTVTDGTTISAPATISVSVTAPPTVHVADLDATTVKLPGEWQANATIRVHGSSHAGVAGATVSGTWSTGQVATCTTTATGACTFATELLVRKLRSVTVTVTSVTLTGAAYDAASNHDPDGDSTGTSIEVERP